MQEIRNGQKPFPTIRVMRNMIDNVQRSTLKQLLNGELVEFNANGSFQPKDWFQTTLPIRILAVSNVQVLYLENIDIDDYQMKELIKTIQINKKIVGLNLGETSLADPPYQCWFHIRGQNTSWF